MNDHDMPPQATTILMQALNWAFDQATASTIPGLDKAADHAEKFLKKSGGAPEKAIDALIARQTSYAFGAGFVTNIGGLVTLPVSIPGNLASVLLIQLRMIAAIAYLRGYRIDDQRVRTMAFLCLTGSSAAAILQEFGINFSTKLSTRLITQISGATLARINHAVGFRLVANAGSSGLINLIKVIPLVSGLAGGTFDAVVTRGIGAVAKKIFAPLETDASGDADAVSP